MHVGIRRMVEVSTALFITVGVVPVSLGVASTSYLLAVALVAFSPFLFAELLWLGFKRDEVFGAEDAWQYTVPSKGHTDTNDED